MARPVPPPIQPQAPTPDPSVTFAQFDGLRNLVTPENLTPRDLARARNVDLDDAGQLHRRRGYRKAIIGNFHSLYRSESGRVYAVKDGTFVQVNTDFTVTTLVTGVQHLAYAEVGTTLYATGRENSFQVDMPTGRVRGWGIVQGHTFQPGVEPGAKDFWYSPIVNPTEDLGPVMGRLFGAPPLGEHVCYFDGRLYIAADRVLWMTELFLYDYVDKTKGFRSYEHKITALGVVEDGMYVGTTEALYFVTGKGEQERRTLVVNAGVIPGTMTRVPGQLLTPEARRFPDIPRPMQLGLTVMTNDGLMVLLKANENYNLTETMYNFPTAVRGATTLRKQDGMHTLVSTLDSGGTPAAEQARFGDHLSAVLIRAGTPGQPGENPPLAEQSVNLTARPDTSTTPEQAGGLVVTTQLYDVEGNFLGDLTEPA